MDFRAVFEDSGVRAAPAWSLHQVAKEDFFDAEHLNLMGVYMMGFPIDELNCIEMTIEWILDTVPHYGLLWIPYLDDLPSLMRFRAWVIGGEQGSNPLLS